MIAFSSRVQLVTETNEDPGRDIVGRNDGRNGFNFDGLFLHAEIRKGSRLKSMKAKGSKSS